MHYLFLLRDVCKQQWSHQPIFNQCFTSIPPENICFSDVFKGYRSGTLVENGLNGKARAMCRLQCWIIVINSFSCVWFVCFVSWGFSPFFSRDWKLLRDHYEIPAHSRILTVFSVNSARLVGRVFYIKCYCNKMFLKNKDLDTNEDIQEPSLDGSPYHIETNPLICRSK